MTKSSGPEGSLTSNLPLFVQLPQLDTATLRELPDIALRVLVCLCHHRNSKTGRTFPGVTRIAAEIDRAESSVSRGISALKKAGLIEVRRRFGTSNEYHLIYPTSACLQDLSPVRELPDSGSRISHQQEHEALTGESTKLSPVRAKQEEGNKMKYELDEVPYLGFDPVVENTRVCGSGFGVVGEVG